MGFFKDLKEDFSDAVDELIPGGKADDDEFKKKEDISLATENKDVDVEEELNKLDGLLASVSKKVDSKRETGPVEPVEIPKPSFFSMDSDNVTEPGKVFEETPKEETPSFSLDEMKEIKPETEETAKTEEKENTDMDSNNTFNFDSLSTPVEEPEKIETPAPAPVEEPAATYRTQSAGAAPVDQNAVSDENAVITAGMTITGDLTSTGSISVEGLINGNVNCNGKLTVTGTIKGNSTSSEFFADQAKIEGEVTTQGTVKVGVGSVIIGNINATSAVIAGAVKGDIDVQGPVVVDTSAVVMGNIKSRSVQINNGAVIQGFCS
nr:polymer-forming cytoskeletal protein [Lachnospiraceae bacterium]